MGRRNLHSKEELKEIILEACYDIIQKKGLKDITARSIASKIGYTAGTLYQFFSSLDSILLELKSRALDKFELTFKEYFKKNIFSIKLFFTFYINYCLHSHQDWVLLSEKILDKETIPEWYQEKVLALFEMLVQYVMIAKKIKHEDASRLTKMMWASAQGLCMLS